MGDRMGGVPRLRFPEFQEAGDWRITLLGDLGTFTGGGTPSKSNSEYWQGNIPWISSSDVSDESITKINITRFITKDALENSATKLVPKDSILLVSRVGVGKLAVSASSVCTSQDFTSFTPHKDDLHFLAYYLKSNSQTLQELCQGMAIQGFTKEDISKLEIHLPAEKEQQKIAACLSSLDALIAAQADKLDALKTHKKGLMQQLFPREGETVPRLRFPEFQDAGGWEEKRIGDLNPFVTSGSRGWAAFYSDHGSLFVRITNLSRDSIYLNLNDRKFVKLPEKSSEGIRTQLKEGDVLISITADIGIIGYVDASVPSPSYINQHIALVRFNMSQVNSKFVSYFLASESSQCLFRASTDTGTKAGMSLITVQKIQVALPSLPEQQKIATCLTSLDTLITAQAEKLTTLKTHKKALMQQLFPTTPPTP